MDRHSHLSSLREEYLEYIFLGEMAALMWTREMVMEVLRSQTDAMGYDLILEANGVQRHVQLKGSKMGARTSRQVISLNLGAKPSGCVVWMWFDPEILKIDHFLWFGGAPGVPLPDPGDKVARHVKGDSTGAKKPRDNLRMVSKDRFDRIDTMEDLVEKLFGRAISA